ncbi:MAG: hypothetical protein GVY16_06795 [Planctomycetes bacterium]|nr:hypothetical protein [Phycisphaerae bacterium]NBB95434.1 hypothetical protein [Planctomycetota bacterium]
MSESNTQAAEASSPDRVACSPNNDPGVRLFIAAGLLLAMGVYCVIDIMRGAYTYVSPSEDFNAFASWAFNFAGQFVFSLPGLVLLVWGVLYFRRTCVADAAGIHYAYFSSEPIRWEQIERIDASQLKSKGILKVHATDGRHVTLDSWKLKNFKPLVSYVEQNVPVENIDTQSSKQ